MEDELDKLARERFNLFIRNTILMGAIAGVVIGMFLALVLHLCINKTSRCVICERRSSYVVYDSHGEEYGVCTGCLRKLLGADK